MTDSVESKPANQDNDINLDRDMVRLTRALVVWTAALFGGALIAAAIAYFQLRAMQGQLHEMRSSSSDTHDLTMATERLAAQANRQADAIDKLQRSASS